MEEESLLQCNLIYNVKTVLIKSQGSTGGQTEKHCNLTTALTLCLRQSFGGKISTIMYS